VGTDGAQRVLADLRAEGLLEDPDLIVSALAARGVPTEHLKTVATMAGMTAWIQPVRQLR
jgi:hypothetical protein